MSAKDDGVTLVAVALMAMKENPKDKFEIAISACHMIKVLARQTLAENPDEHGWHEPAIKKLTDAVR